MEAFFQVFMLFLVANIVLVIWALVDAIKVPDDSMYQAGGKLVWVLVILFGGFVGAIIYLVIGRPRVVAGPGAAPGGTGSSPRRHPGPWARRPRRPRSAGGDGVLNLAFEGWVV
jgi:hypothetical protein